MRNITLLILIGVMVFLAMDSTERTFQTFDGSVVTHYDGWKIRLFGTRLPAEVFVLALIVLVLFAFPNRRRQKAAGDREAATEDLQAMRDINLTLEHMERRIESLETILLAPEARLKKAQGPAETGQRLNI